MARVFRRLLWWRRKPEYVHVCTQGDVDGWC